MTSKPHPFSHSKALLVSLLTLTVIALAGVCAFVTETALAGPPIVVDVPGTDFPTLQRPTQIILDTRPLQPTEQNPHPERGLLVLDTKLNQIKRVGLDGRTALVAGAAVDLDPLTEVGWDDWVDGSSALQTILKWPTAIALTPTHEILVADLSGPGTGRVRAIDRQGMMRLVAGNQRRPMSQGNGDGDDAKAAHLNPIKAIAAVPRWGGFVIAEHDRIRWVDGNNRIKTVVGGGDQAVEPETKQSCSVKLSDIHAVSPTNDGGLLITTRLTLLRLSPYWDEIRIVVDLGESTGAAEAPDGTTVVLESEQISRLGGHLEDFVLEELIGDSCNYYSYNGEGVVATPESIGIDPTGSPVFHGNNFYFIDRHTIRFVDTDDLFTSIKADESASESVSKKARVEDSRDDRQSPSQRLSTRAIAKYRRVENLRPINLLGEQDIGSRDPARPIHETLRDLWSESLPRRNRGSLKLYTDLLPQNIFDLIVPFAADAQARSVYLEQWRASLNPYTIDALSAMPQEIDTNLTLVAFLPGDKQRIISHFWGEIERLRNLASKVSSEVVRTRSFWQINEDRLLREFLARGDLDRLKARCKDRYPMLFL